MNQVELNSAEVKDLLRYMIKNNAFIQEDGDVPTSIEVTGESGLGKTSIIEQIANENNLHFVKVNLSQIEEIGDLVGIPLQEYKMFKKTGTTEAGAPKGQIKWVSRDMITAYVAQGFVGTEDTRTSYSPPAWLVGKNDKGGILLLDDYSRADIRFMQAIMEILDRQEYISWKLPKGWNVILTSNPDNGEYIVTPLDTAQKTRYTSIVMKWDAKVWAQWAERNKVDTRCINFMLMNPEIVSPKVNPRALTTFFKSIKSITNFENLESLSLIQKLAEGSVGSEVALMFTEFIGNKLDKLISPEDILLHEDPDFVIRRLKESVGEGTNFQNAIASIMNLRIMNYALYYAEENTITKDITDRLSLLITRDDILTPDISFVLAKKLNASGKFTNLMMNAQVQEMILK
jgi:ATPase family associated with various cellular activities (AAA)